MTVRQVIELKEYQTIDGVQLTDSEIEWLKHRFSKALELRISSNGSVGLTATSWIGRICLPGVEIRIHPKLPLNRIWNWLSWAYDLKSLRWTGSTGFDSNFEDMDWLIRFYLKACERIAAFGLRKDYISLEDVIPSVKGTLQSSLTVGRWLKQDYRFDCRYDEFTSWVNENRCIFAGLQSMRKLQLKDESLYVKLKALMDVFGQERSLLPLVTLSDSIGNQLLSRMPANRLNRQYSEAFSWLRLYWNCATIVDAEGVVKAESFLLDMNELYEAYVAARFRASLEPEGIRVIAQQHDWLAEEGRIKIVPDLILRDSSGREIIVDTKYKKKKDDASINADVFQVLAYLTALRSNTAVLLYASGPERGDRIKNAGFSVFQWSLKLESAGDNSDAEESMLLDVISRIKGLFDI
jgi:5-methylcytosine-specific restriction enzyme subunit McrC